MDQMVAADGKRIAIARYHPHRQIGTGYLEAGRDRRGSAVDRVEAVRVHVVRKAARAADAGDEHEVLARHAELGQELLDLRQDGVVPAAGAPADVLIGDEILAAEGRGAHDCTSFGSSLCGSSLCGSSLAGSSLGDSSRGGSSSPERSRVLRATSSETLKGRPWIFWKPIAGTRYSARS